MIDYDSKIDAHDISRYWTGGVVLLEHEGVWSGYCITGIGGDDVVSLTIRKDLANGEPPKNVSLSRPEFFRLAILHRPRLGAVATDDGHVVILSWMPSGNTMNKSLQDSDIIVRKVVVEGEDDELGTFQAACTEWSEAITSMREAL